MPDLPFDTGLTRSLRWLAARAGGPTLALIAVAVAAIVIATRHRGVDGGTAEERRAATERVQGDSVVTLDSAALALIDIQLGPVGTAEGNVLVANGTITFDANHASVVAPRVEGKLVALTADLGDIVTPGAVLVRLASPEVGQVRGELARATAQLDVTRQSFERESRLYAASISALKEKLEAEAAYRGAQADVASATARLRALGVVDGDAAEFGLKTPIGGTVVERNGMPGQVVGPSSNLFTVADLRRVWVSVDVYEADMRRVRQGARVTLLPRALPDATFRGRVTYAGGVVDTLSRTFKVRVEVDNPAQQLRPGMFAEIRIEAPLGASAAARSLVIPELAVQELDGKSVVFVPGTTRGRFVARQVGLGPRSGGVVSVLKGLRAGERIVTVGAFQLRAEMQKASFGERE